MLNTINQENQRKIEDWKDWQDNEVIFADKGYNCVTTSKHFCIKLQRREMKKSSLLRGEALIIILI